MAVTTVMDLVVVADLSVTAVTAAGDGEAGTVVGAGAGTTGPGPGQKNLGAGAR